jgi:hypothetical protein
MKDIDHNKLVNTIQTIMGSKCQAQKKSHNLGTPEVPRPHYQCIDKFQMHQHQTMCDGQCQTQFQAHDM